MNMYEALTSYRLLSLELKNLNDMITGLRIKIENAPVQKLSDMPKSHRMINIEDVFIKIQNMEEKYINKLDFVCDLQEDIENKLNAGFYDIERIIIRKYYIEGKTWAKVAEETDFSERQVYNIMKKLKKRLQCIAVNVMV